MADKPMLYWNPISQPSRSVFILLNKLGVDLELKIVDLTKGEHKSPEYTKLNPNQKVPTVVDDDMVLWESGAILMHYADLNKSDLYPSDLKKRFPINRYINWHHLNTRKECIAYVFGGVLGPKLFGLPEPTPEQMEALKANVSAVLDHVSALLWEHKYIAGDDLTIADLMLFTELQNLQMLAAWDFTDCVKIADYMAAVGADEHVKLGTAALMETLAAIGGAAEPGMSEEERALQEENERLKAQLAALTREKDSITRSAGGLDDANQFHLYHFPGTRSTRVLWLAYEMEVEPKIHPVTFKSIKKTDYLAINPNGLIPAAKFGDMPMFEAGGIMRELVRTHGEELRWIFPEHWTKENWARHHVYEFWTVTELDKRIVSKLFGLGKVKNAFTGSVRKWFTNVVCPKVLQDLADNDYINGPEFSATDVYVGYTLSLAQWASLPLPPPIKAYLSRIQARDAYKKAFVDVKLG